MKIKTKNKINMKKGTKLFIYPFIVLGFILALSNSCKKEDTKIDPVITWANPADITYGTLLSAIQLNATADVPGTFIYTPPAGTKLSVGASQDLKVDFTPTDATTYSTASKTVKINVTAFNKKDPVITWANPADICYGTLLTGTQLNAIADVPGTYIYTPPTGTKLNEGSNQDLKVDFTPTDATTYNTASKTVKINVTPFNKKDPVITWANPADICFGTLLTATHLNATADLPGTFIYTPPAGTKLNEGSNQNLKVDFTPTDTTKCNTASKTVIINVTAPLPVIDIDGNGYHIVTIGTQTWMVENLKTTRYRNGDPIPNVTDDTKWGNLSTGAYCNYDYKPDNSAIYGKLYNWHAVNDSRNIAPTGWHVPTNAEWTTLEKYVAANPGISGSVAKALASTINWDSSANEGAIGNDLTKNNSTGFTALPGGYRYFSGYFDSIGMRGYWWSSNEYGSYSACYRSLFCNKSNLNSELCFENYKGGGFSVRCLKD
jgi:uncharacterized protein (TIGR02145 family)